MTLSWQPVSRPLQHVLGAAGRHGDHVLPPREWRPPAAAPGDTSFRNVELIYLKPNAKQVI